MYVTSPTDHTPEPLGLKFESKHCFSLLLTKTHVGTLPWLLSQCVMIESTLWFDDVGVVLAFVQAQVCSSQESRVGDGPATRLCVCVCHV